MRTPWLLHDCISGWGSNKTIFLLSSGFAWFAARQDWTTLRVALTNGIRLNGLCNQEYTYAQGTVKWRYCSPFSHKLLFFFHFLIYIPTPKKSVGFFLCIELTCSWERVSDCFQVCSSSWIKSEPNGGGKPHDQWSPDPSKQGRAISKGSKHELIAVWRWSADFCGVLLAFL